MSVTVTPTPSITISQLLQTPVGTISLFGFKTPIPFPFGGERTGYLVTDMGAAIKAARASGADVVVSPFPDPIGVDAIIQWPGGMMTQIYWHTSWPLIETITARGYSCLPAKTGCTLDFDQTNFRISHWSSPPRHCRSCSCIRSSESRTSCGFLKTEQRFARTIWTSNGKSGRVLRRATMTLKSFHHVG